jgi:hypothetical protein
MVWHTFYQETAMTPSNCITYGKSPRMNSDCQIYCYRNGTTRLFKKASSKPITYIASKHAKHLRLTSIKTTNPYSRHHTKNYAEGKKRCDINEDQILITDKGEVEKGNR